MPKEMVRFKRRMLLIKDMNKIIEKNTSKLWDAQVWTSQNSIEEDKYNLTRALNSVAWRRIKKRILKNFGSFKDIKSIEIGAGQGTFSLLFAMEGAEVTVLDYSENALNSSRLFFKRMGQKATFIQMDALKLDKKIKSKFDVAMSYGTAEHFSGEKRINFIRSHLDVIRKGGLVLISVPNKWNLIYRLWMFLSQTFGRWKFGEEYPFSRKEFRKIGNLLNIKFEIIGGYLFFSNFLIKKRLKKLGGMNQYPKKINYEIGTPLDKYFSQTIIAIGAKFK